MRADTFSAFLYLYQAESFSDDTPDEWFEPICDPTYALIVSNEVYLDRFIERTQTLMLELTNLELNDDESSAQQYMTLFYNAAKDVFDGDKSRIRQYFEWLYFLVFERFEGPRWGDFVDIYGVEAFVNRVYERMEQFS